MLVEGMVFPFEIGFDMTRRQRIATDGSMVLECEGNLSIFGAEIKKHCRLKTTPLLQEWCLQNDLFLSKHQDVTGGF